jgi:AraC-like DNA-binding protein
MTTKEHTTYWHRTHTQIIYREIFENAGIFMNQDIASFVYLQDFCRVLGYSRRSVQRAFSFHGTTWSKYLLAIRMQRACKMLKNTSFSYNEIAKMVGYSDTPQFRRRFKEHCGISPNEYREQSR